MEPSRFDGLTKALATATSRRQALKVIAATTLGGILGLGAISMKAAYAWCLNDGHHCGNHKQCCSGLCQKHTCVTISTPTPTPTPIATP